MVGPEKKPVGILRFREGKREKRGGQKRRSVSQGKDQGKHQVNKAGLKKDQNRCWPGQGTEKKIEARRGRRENYSTWQDISGRGIVLAVTRTEGNSDWGETSVHD